MQGKKGFKKKGHQKVSDITPEDKFNMELDEARKVLVEGIPEEAIKIARRAMTEYQAKRPENQMLLMPVFFVLAEAYISDKNQEEKQLRLKQAEDFLFAAYVTYTQYNEKNMSGEGMDQDDAIPIETVNDLKAILDKTFAKLFIAQNFPEKAIDYLTKGIYMDSKRYGPESVHVAMSYYTMGTIFEQKTNKPQEVKAFYDKTVDIWFKYLLRYLQENNDLQIEMLDIDETLAKKASNIIDNIKVYFNNLDFDDQQQYIQTMNMINYTLGLLFKIQGENDLAGEYLRQVQQKYAEYENHEEVERLNKIIEKIDG